MKLFKNLWIKLTKFFRVVLSEKEPDPKLVEKEKEELFDYFFKYMTARPYSEKNKKHIREFYQSIPKSAFAEAANRHYRSLEEIEVEGRSMKDQFRLIRLQKITNDLSRHELDVFIDQLKKVRGNK